MEHEPSSPHMFLLCPSQTCFSQLCLAEEKAAGRVRDDIVDEHSLLRFIAWSGDHPKLNHWGEYILGPQVGAVSPQPNVRCIFTWQTCSHKSKKVSSVPSESINSKKLETPHSHWNSQLWPITSMTLWKPAWLRCYKLHDSTCLFVHVS